MKNEDFLSLNKKNIEWCQNKVHYSQETYFLKEFYQKDFMRLSFTNELFNSKKIKDHPLF